MSTSTTTEPGMGHMRPTPTAEEVRHRQWFPFSGKGDMRHPAIKRAQEDRTRGERVADDIAHFGGSWPFIFLFLGLIFGWMILNTVVLARVIHHKQFDPYPYIALNLMLSALAGLQAPVILMSQNRSAVRDEALAGHHYEESQRIQGIVETQRQLLEQNTEITTHVQELLQTNTDLTQQVRDLTEKIRDLVAARG